MTHSSAVAMLPDRVDMSMTVAARRTTPTAADDADDADDGAAAATKANFMLAYSLILVGRLSLDNYRISSDGNGERGQPSSLLVDGI